MKIGHRLVAVGTALVVAAVLGAVTAPARNAARPGQDAASLALERYGGPERPEELQAWYDYFYGQRSAPGSHVPGAARAAAAVQARVLGAPGRVRAAAGAVWTNLGPQPINSADLTYNDHEQGTPPLGWQDVSGRVSALAVKPDDPSTIYMGAADGGVWKSVDSGLHWTPIGDDDFDTQAVGAVAVDPNHPDDLYVGTGEATSAFENYYGDGIYFSNDGGASFTKLNDDPFVRLAIYRIRVSGAGDILAATNQGLFRSTDHGASWDMVLAPGRGVGPEADAADPGGSWISDVSYIPGTGDRDVLAAVGWRNGDNHNGFYLSHNGGTTFTRLHPEGLPGTPHFGRTTFDISSTHPKLIWAVIEDPVKLLLGRANALSGVFRTTAGANGPWELKAWSHLFGSDPGSSLGHLRGYSPGVQAWYNQFIYINPLDEDNVVVGLEEVYNTDDGGDSWRTIGRYWNFCPEHQNIPPACWIPPEAYSHYTTHPDQHAAAFAVVNGQAVLYDGNDGGVWSQVRDADSFDNDSWVNLNATISITQPYYAEPSAGPNPVIYSGTQDNGSLKYTGSGWSEVISGDGGDVAVEPNNANHTYEEYVFLWMSKSKDGGQNWVPIPPPDAYYGLARFIAPFDLDPLNPRHIWALGQHVWLSRKGVDTHTSTWLRKYNFGPGNFGTALAVRGDVVYAGWCGPGGCNPAAIDGSDPAPFVRGLATNVGGTWHATAAGGLPNRYITSVTMDPSDNSHIYLTLSAYSRHWIPSAGYGHVFESHDAGESFTDISANLPDAPANDTVLFQGRLIVGTDVGVFERLSDGSWAPLGTGMPATSTLDLSVVPGGSTLVAATHGRGIWTLPLL